MSYSYKKVEVSNNTNTYIEVLFTDPNTSVMNENKAYIVNIFEKVITNATSQWSSYGLSGFKFADGDATNGKGATITKGQVTDL